MVLSVHVEGFDAFFQEVGKHEGKSIVACFSGSVGENGISWCPDCVTAAPVIERGLRSAPEDTVYIYCGVGGRDYWKNQNNDFRTNPKLMVKSVPTLLKYNTPQRLEEGQCSDENLVQMFFEED